MDSQSFMFNNSSDEHWMSNVYDILAIYNEYAPMLLCEQLISDRATISSQTFTPSKNQPVLGMGDRGYYLADSSRDGKLPCPTMFLEVSWFLAHWKPIVASRMRMMRGTWGVIFPVGSH